MSRFPRWMRIEQQAADLAKIAAIIDTAEDTAPAAKTKRARNTAADARVLRMIPAVAEGVKGTIPGTDPLAETIARERTRQIRSR